jgi:hypothetical protein
LKTLRDPIEKSTGKLSFTKNPNKESLTILSLIILPKPSLKTDKMNSKLSALN